MLVWRCMRSDGMGERVSTSGTAEKMSKEEVRGWAGRWSVLHVTFHGQERSPGAKLHDVSFCGAARQCVPSAVASRMRGEAGADGSRGSVDGVEGAKQVRRNVLGWGRRGKTRKVL